MLCIKEVIDTLAKPEVIEKKEEKAPMRASVSVPVPAVKSTEKRKAKKQRANHWDSVEEDQMEWPQDNDFCAPPNLFKEVKGNQYEYGDPSDPSLDDEYEIFDDHGAERLSYGLFRGAASN